MIFKIQSDFVKFIFALPGLGNLSHFCLTETLQSFKNFCKLVFVASSYLNSLILLLHFCYCYLTLNRATGEHEFLKH